MANKTNQRLSAQEWQEKYDLLNEENISLKRELEKIKHAQMVDHFVAETVYTNIGEKEQQNLKELETLRYEKIEWQKANKQQQELLQNMQEQNKIFIRELDGLKNASPSKPDLSELIPENFEKVTLVHASKLFRSLDDFIKKAQAKINEADKYKIDLEEVIKSRDEALNMLKQFFNFNLED